MVLHRQVLSGKNVKAKVHMLREYSGDNVLSNMGGGGGLIVS
jgi:hypothetical protein